MEIKEVIKRVFNENGDIVAVDANGNSFWMGKREEYEAILKELEVLDYYEKIKLMLKQKGCVLRYIESEDCFAVRTILDDHWYKLSKSLVEDNINEEIKPSPLIDKVIKQNKILEILKNKKVCIYVLSDFVRRCVEDNFILESYNHYVRDDRRLTQEEYDLIKEVLDNEKSIY